MIRLSKRQIALVGIILAVGLLTAAIAAACPTCKDAVAANDPEHAGIVKGYFYSILLMMGMPFTLLGCFSLYMYREVQKARVRDAAKASTVSGPVSVVRDRTPVEV